MLFIFIFLSILLFSSSQIVLEENDKCETYGVCKRISECDVALRKITSLSPHNLTRCGFSGLEEIVCCEMIEGNSAQNHIRVMDTTNHSIVIDKSLAPLVRSRAQIECDNMIPNFPVSTDSYIVGGENASVGEFPHMVAILRYNTRDSVFQLVCGGSLIAVQWVLTGAHCQVEASQWKVSIGTLGSGEGSHDSQETDYKITEVYNHPEYSRIVKYNDISLLKLDRPVPITATSHPACLYTSSELPKSKVIVTGWGAMEFNPGSARTSPSLIKATLSIIPNSVCRDQYKIVRPLPKGITEHQMCAADYENHRDTCLGDSGGPLQIINPLDGVYRIVGVTSFGKVCGTDAGGVYTRVASFVPWIESVVWPE